MLAGLSCFHLGLNYPVGVALAPTARLKSQPTRLLFDLLSPEMGQAVLADDCGKIRAQALNHRIAPGHR